MRSTPARPPARWRRRRSLELAAMLGLAEPSLGHLTASGTIANLEALWVARELHPDKGVAYGANAHYTHGRMCQVLRMPAQERRGHSRGPDRPRRARRRLRGRRHRHRRADRRHHRARRGRPDRRGARAAGAPRRAHPRRRRVRRLLPAARRRAGRAARDRRGRLDRHRSAQARPPTVRVRGRRCSPIPASAASTRTTRRTRTSRRTRCTWGRSASSARAPARPPPRCG